MTAALEADVRVERGSFDLRAALRVGHGEIVALLGPNGSGKSTLLGALAGLVPLSAGTITVAGRTLSRAGAGARLSVPPERRGVGLLGQEPLLFPHLSALDNVAFGRRSSGVRTADARADARDWLDAVGLAGLGDRKPAALSGGQQQRVALARALAARPRVLLLDEPFAAIDVQTASVLRQLLRERLAGTATVLVTHDVLDALVVADRVAILQDGRIIDDGPRDRVLGTPRNRFIAALAGVNLVYGEADGRGGLATADGRRFAGRVLGTQPVVGAPVAAVFRPSAVAVDPLPPDAPVGHSTSPANSWAATIGALEPSSAGIRIRLVESADVVADVSPLEVAEHALEVGGRVRLRVAETEVTLHVRQPATVGAPGR